MARTVTCSACGKGVEPGDYCSRCGTGLDEESQRRVELEYHASSEQRRLESVCEELKRFAREDLDEEAALDRIKRRIGEAELSAFVDEELSPT